MHIYAFDYVFVSASLWNSALFCVNTECFAFICEVNNKCDIIRYWLLLYCTDVGCPPLCFIFISYLIFGFDYKQGIARTQSPSPRNYALESSTFEMIGWVNPSEVQWTGLANEEPPWWSRYLPCQVSMLWNVQNRKPSNLDFYKFTVLLKWKVKCGFPQVYWLCILFGLKENCRMSF